MKKLGIYVHVPFCKRRCGYCSFCSVTDLSLVDDYIQAVEKEIKACADKILCDYDADTVYFGGGTPSVLTERQLGRLSEAVLSLCGSAPNEFTAECNPESVTEEKLRAFRAAGINRISLGAQSTDDGVLRRIGRLHNAGDVRSSLEKIAKLFDRYSVDFMLNLPGQTKRDIDDMARLVREFKIPHVSAYGLKLEEGTPLYGKIELDEDAAADLYDRAAAALEDAGLNRYEISNFARPGYECFHNLKYWNLDEYLGIGASAHSFLGGVRFFNTDNVLGYIAGTRRAGEERVSGRDAMFEYIMLSLRTERGLSEERFRELFHRDFAAEYSPAIAACGELLEHTQSGYRVRKDAFYVVNNLLIKFL